MYWLDKVIFYIGENRNIYYIIYGSRFGKKWLDKNLVSSFKSGYIVVEV